MSAPRISLPHPLLSIVFILSLAGYCLMSFDVFNSPDTAWHIATGDWIRAHGRLPETDIWSYSAQGLRWIDISWLWDIGMSFLYEKGGTTGLTALSCFMGALNITVLCACLKARAEALDPYIVFVAVIAWLSQLALLFPLPSLVTILFTPVFHYLLHSASRDGTVDKKRAMTLAAMMVLWTNLHGGFVTGFTILAVYLIEAVVEQNRPQIMALLKITALCAAASLINPYHIHIVEGVMRSLGTSIAPLLNDWKPFTFGDLATSAPLVMFILCSNIRDPLIRLSDKALSILWLCAAFLASRNGILFAMLAAPYMAVSMQELARTAQKERFKSANFAAGPAARRRNAIMIIPLTLAILVLYLPTKKPDIHAYNPANAKELVELVRKNYPDVHFYNDYDTGSVLILASGGSWKVSVDSRAGTAYPEEVLKDYVNFETSSKGAEDVIRKYGAHGLVLSRATRHADQPPGPWHWKRIYSNALLVAYIEE